MDYPLLPDKQVQFWGPEHSDGAAPPSDGASGLPATAHQPSCQAG